FDGVSAMASAMRAKRPRPAQTLRCVLRGLLLFPRRSTRTFCLRQNSHRFKRNSQPALRCAASITCAVVAGPALSAPKAIPRVRLPRTLVALGLRFFAGEIPAQHFAHLFEHLP